MSHVILALGSNCQPAAHIHWASARLSMILHDVRFSRTRWTPDIHGTGIFYLNRLAVGTTDLTADDLQQTLKALEAETCRTRHRVTLDLDLMQYADQRFHEKDWQRPYIQQLIPDIL